MICLLLNIRSLFNQISSISKPDLILILIVLCDLTNLCSGDSFFFKTLDMKFIFFLIYSSSIENIQTSIIREEWESATLWTQLITSQQVTFRYFIVHI
ncbi:hypothetical protein Hanom_Chr11g01054761 [Helianthus anomalus]